MAAMLLVVADVDAGSPVSYRDGEVHDSSDLVGETDIELFDRASKRAEVHWACCRNSHLRGDRRRTQAPDALLLSPSLDHERHSSIVICRMHSGGLLQRASTLPLRMTTHKEQRDALEGDHSQLLVRGT
jgi:hypothetical protein